MENEVKTGRIEQVNIDQQMRSAYIDYSMSVIVSRALPDEIGKSTRLNSSHAT